MLLANKNIIVGVTGGIAAYKTAELCRQLREHSANIRVVMTTAAKEFITPITLQAVSGNPVHDELLSREAEMAMGHIELARWAELIIVAPASADFIARLAHGHANDLLTTVCLATKAPIMIAPAMNMHMWENVATQANIALLHQRNIHTIGPASGSQACGDVGYGRMSEPVDIIAAMGQRFQQPYLAGKRVLITAGPTQEPIDPVRFISNHSSGKMGYALAKACQEAGATVTLVSGPVHVKVPEGVHVVKVITALEMHHAVKQHVSNCDIFIAAAAVADYRPVEIAEHKLKKSNEQLSIVLTKNMDIVADIAAMPNKPYTVGFAAETENVIAHAKQKLANKKLDMIVANKVGHNEGFHVDDHEVVVVDNQGQQELTQAKKIDLARKLVAIIAQRLKS